MRIICSKCKLICLCSCRPIGSSVRRMFERGVGGRKFENNEDQKKNFSTQNQSFFLPKIRERPKKKVTKRRFTKISPVFGPNFRENPKKTSLYPDSVLLCAETFCPSYKGGGGGYAAILHTILC